LLFLILIFCFLFVDILRTLIVQDPEISDMGAAFFLSTIATFGDPKAGVLGMVTGSDWQTWWTSVLQYLYNNFPDFFKFQLIPNMHTHFRIMTGMCIERNLGI
jgi:hypothetical protein